MSRKQRNKAQRRRPDGFAEPALALAAAVAGADRADAGPVISLADEEVDDDNGVRPVADSDVDPDSARVAERKDMDADAFADPKPAKPAPEAESGPEPVNRAESDPASVRGPDAGPGSVPDPDAAADGQTDWGAEPEIESVPGPEIDTESEDTEPDQEPLSGVSRFLHPQQPFLKGAVFGLVLLIPLTALTVYVLGKLGIGDSQSSYYSVIAFVAVFAGVPAILSAGGIGRAAASALVGSGERSGPVMSLRVAALQTAFTEIGLVLLSVVPLGEIPTNPGHWASIIALGAAAGALGGCVLGLWIVDGSR